jgi:predicted AlkP superfamily pyrophosphatase or phosphodiesterase
MKNIILAILLAVTTITIAQNKKPKLVIGIVVDQMRYDYLDPPRWCEFSEA